MLFWNFSFCFVISSLAIHAVHGHLRNWTIGKPIKAHQTDRAARPYAAANLRTANNTGDEIGRWWTVRLPVLF